MTTAILTHEECLEHLTPPGHPECRERLEAVIGALKTEDLASLSWHEAPLAELPEIEAVHSKALVNNVTSLIPDAGFGRIDADTAVSPRSLRAALRAAGAVVTAVDMVANKQVDNAFCAVRPPGHHAEPEQAMGFCLFNNVAIGAVHAQLHHGFQRVAVMDFDVHHGNGTQAAFWDHGNLFYASTHQSPHYPGTGHPTETGVHGNILNVPLAPGSGSAEFRQAMEEAVLPAMNAFAPDFVLISAGFDAYHADPLSNLNFDEDDYAWATRRLREVAQKSASGRIVSSLEGGYHIGGLASCTRAHVEALAE